MRYRKSDVAQADTIDDNAVVINGASLQCFLLNDMAAILWDAVDHYQERDALLALLDEAGIDAPAQVLDRWTTDMVAAGLVEAEP
jgi:hypothetical protein